VELNGVSLVGQFDGRNENNLDEPLTIPAGEIHFVLRNVGTLAHNFQVRLPDGTNLKKTRNVGPKKTGELVITLEPGRYLIACPISDHDKRGMLRTLVVTAAEE
jgi:FtsP/CotA-like multicopper oxidase with cupredoxin domain